MNETFLIFKDNEKTGLYEEHILSLDTDENALLEIELNSGVTVDQYYLGICYFYLIEIKFFNIEASSQGRQPPCTVLRRLSDISNLRFAFLTSL